MALKEEGAPLLRCVAELQNEMIATRKHVDVEARLRAIHAIMKQRKRLLWWGLPRKEIVLAGVVLSVGVGIGLICGLTREHVQVHLPLHSMPRLEARSRGEACEAGESEPGMGTNATSEEPRVSSAGTVWKSNAPLEARARGNAPNENRAVGGGLGKMLDGTRANENRDRLMLHIRE